MIDAETILRASRSILVVDWPTSDLPETLVRAGCAVHVKVRPIVRLELAPGPSAGSRRPA